MTQIKIIRREILRLSQEELARLCGVGQSTVARWEAGESEPLVSHAVIIARWARANRRRRLTLENFAEARP